jgi:hypothetical protein
MCTLRRFLFLVFFSFWQGGFTFYAAVVVPIGTEELRSSVRQGFITRRVTESLNWTAVAALVPLTWDALASRDPSRFRWLARLGLCLLLALSQAALFYLHPILDSMMQRQGFIILDHDSFRPLHRLYLWVQTVQWGVAVVLLLLTVLAWRAEDRHGGIARC